MDINCFAGGICATCTVELIALIIYAIVRKNKK